MVWHNDLADAVPNEPASSAEYNKVVDNVQDLDARLGAVTSASTAHSRLNTLEARTTNVSTGNTQLGTRVSSLESVTTNGTTGNTALGNRVTVLENADVTYAYQTTQQAIGSGTAITMQATTIDTNDLWVVGSPTRITAKKAGIYLVGGGVGMAGGGLAASRRLAYIQKNGVSIPGMVTILPPTSNTSWNLMVSVSASPVSLAVGDYLEIFGYWGAEDTSGVTKQTVVNAGYNSFLSIAYLRPS